MPETGTSLNVRDQGAAALRPAGSNYSRKPERHIDVTRMPAQTYDRAERLRGQHRGELVLRSVVKPDWVGNTGRFSYRVITENGGEFFLVDPAAGSKVPAFDQRALAAALSAASGEQVEPFDLPFTSIEIVDDGVDVEAFGSCWHYRADTAECIRTGPAPAGDPAEVASPDGRWVAFRREDDVWVREVASGNEFALTEDGTTDRSYARPAGSVGVRYRQRKLGVNPKPALTWSPDSSRILTHRIDEREIGWAHLVEAAPDSGGRPELTSYRYAVPGERLPRAEWVVLGVEDRSVVRAAEPFDLAYLSPLTTGRAWWAPDGSAVHVLDTSRDQHTLRLLRLDPVTGEQRTVLTETGETRVGPSQFGAPMVKVLAGGAEALWYSQRDGWPHLYRYDLTTGRPVEQLTKGEFAVRQILHVDEKDRVAHLLVSGLVPEDPYRRSLVTVGLDGGALTRLTDDDLDHQVSCDPEGRWFVDSASTVSTPPVITLRDRTGAVVLDLERADITRLLAAGWTPPERVRAIAADGVTPVYGILYRPADLDPDRRYPVIDHTYPGPQVHRVQPSFDQGPYALQSEPMTALGFAVFALDGRGTPGRDKAFHDQSWRNMGGAGGLADHVAALRQLAVDRPWLDLNRVGIFGSSGGGFATARALLAHGDFYKVGVAEAGNHDNRVYVAGWAETYDGPYDPDAGVRLSNTELAANLTGRLLLVHGEMDDNVSPHQTLRLVDALITANKDFDLLIVPGTEHGFLGRRGYVTRRRWDYFVTHLLGRQPPAGYLLPEPPLTPDEITAAAG